MGKAGILEQTGNLPKGWRRVVDTGGKVPKRFRAENLDQMLLFFGAYNDYQMRVVIAFEEDIDRERLEKAVLLSCEENPILGCRFVENGLRAYWEKIKEPWIDVVRFIDSQNPEDSIHEILTQKVDPFVGPQLMAAIIRHDNKDTLCIVMNHMVCDGAGFKEYLYRLSSIYTNLLQDPNYVPECRGDGNRSLNGLFKQFDVFHRLKLLFATDKRPVHQRDFRFPLLGRASAGPFIMTRKLSEERFDLLKSYSKDLHVTVNDMVLAAYYRALFEIIKVRGGEYLTVPCMVDLRRYLSQGGDQPLCNRSSMMETHLIREDGEDFRQTVRRVNKIMNDKKEKCPGLNGLAALLLMFNIFPYPVMKKIVEKGFNSPLISISNIGVIDAEKLRFGDTLVSNVFISTAIKYTPFFQLTFSSFRNTMTFSISTYGTKKDCEIIQSFLNKLDDELLLD